jgi:hypothetical protein
LRSWLLARPLLLALCPTAPLLLPLAHQQLAPQLALLAQLQLPLVQLHLPAALLLPLLLVLVLLLAQIQVLLVHLLLVPLLLVLPRASAHQLPQHRPQGTERHLKVSLSRPQALLVQRLQWLLRVCRYVERASEVTLTPCT